MVILRLWISSPSVEYYILTISRPMRQNYVPLHDITDKVVSDGHVFVRPVVSSGIYSFKCVPLNIAVLWASHLIAGPVEVDTLASRQRCRGQTSRTGPNPRTHKRWWRNADSYNTRLHCHCSPLLCEASRALRRCRPTVHERVQRKFYELPRPSPETSNKCDQCCVDS